MSDMSTYKGFLEFLRLEQPRRGLSDVEQGVLSAEARIKELEVELKWEKKMRRLHAKDAQHQRIRKDQEKQDNARLKEFATNVIKEHCWGVEMDGLNIQDLAEKLGLIAPHIATEADVDPDEDDYEVGDKIYRFTQALESDKPAEKEDK